MRRTFILHASGAKLPSDLLGLTCVRYGDATTATEIRAVNQKLRKAIESEGRVARIEGLWWQFSLTERTAREPSALGLLKISRDRDGGLELSGRAWQQDGGLSARYWSEAAKEKKEQPFALQLWTTVDGDACYIAAGAGETADELALDRLAPVAITIGTVLVNSFASSVIGFPTVTSTSTLLFNNSVRIARNRSRWPSADRRSTIRDAGSTCPKSRRGMDKGTSKGVNRICAGHVGNRRCGKHEADPMYSR